uniref:Uncharacterized protein n=1 Tax=Globodera rostochiensis TaxID=31243 RepID=A0A914HLK9_GLORO
MTDGELYLCYGYVKSTFFVLGLDRPDANGQTQTALRRKRPDANGQTQTARRNWPDANDPYSHIYIEWPDKITSWSGTSDTADQLKRTVFRSISIDMRPISRIRVLRRFRSMLDWTGA